MSLLRPLAGFGAASLLAAVASAQTVLLTEDFSSGVVPPAGWSEIDLGTAGSAGWEPDVALLLGSEAAWHDDFTGANDTHLMSPAMDFSSVTQVYAKTAQYVRFAAYRDHHFVEVSLDGGVTFIPVLDDVAPDGRSTLNGDLSAFAGTNGVNLSFHYTGDFASEWRIDDVVVDDVAPPPPPVTWPNRPKYFVPAAGYVEDFEGHAGTVPQHMAINALDDLHGVSDPDAWCNIGQQGMPGTGGNGTLAPPHQGSYCLEMGLAPTATNYHDVRNGLVIGLNSAGARNLWLDFWAIDHGEESQTWDGVYVSTNGLNWAPVWEDWNDGIVDLAWQEVTRVDLFANGVNSGDFFLLFAQTDNFPMGFLDGVQIDEIRIYDPTPILEVGELSSGSNGEVNVQGATPNGLIGVAYSLTGPGPSTLSTLPCGPITVELGSPVLTLPLVTADANGSVTFTTGVPPSARGLDVWLQGIDLETCVLTNDLRLRIR